MQWYSSSGIAHCKVSQRSQVTGLSLDTPTLTCKILAALQHVNYIPPSSLLPPPQVFLDLQALHKLGGADCGGKESSQCAIFLVETFNEIDLPGGIGPEGE